MKPIKIILLAGAVAAASAVSAVDWRFTAATNRTPSVSVASSAAVMTMRVKAMRGLAAAEFESRWRSMQDAEAGAFSSTPPVLIIILR